MTVALIVLVFVVALVAVPVVLLTLRLRAGEHETAGSSWGRQFFGRRDDGWGPKSVPARPPKESEQS